MTLRGSAILILALPLLFVSVPADASNDAYFKARVEALTEERQHVLPDGTTVDQQRLRLIALDGELVGQEFDFDGFNDFDVLANNAYRPGDRVLVVASFNDTGERFFYITDYVRTGSLAWLAAIFFLVLIVTTGWKGFRSLLALAASFFILIKVMLPAILSGLDPVLVSLAGGTVVAALVIYVTEGWGRHSHLAVISLMGGLAASGVLAKIFIGASRFSGLTGEEDASLSALLPGGIDFPGLLLAGVIIGTLGVIDDVVVSQLAAIDEIRRAEPGLAGRPLFRRAYRVGTAHVGSMVNTLFLAYAGASLPLLLLFLSGESAFRSWTDIVNYEPLAVEIVRVLAGSIGLVLSVPLATLLGTYFLKSKKA